MHFLIELDGPILDIAVAHYAAYHDTAGEIGWSRVDQSTYWRLVRTKGRDADLLPGARELKTEQYHDAFPRHFESDANLAKLTARDGIREVLTAIRKHGTVAGVTLGTNLKAREMFLDRAGLSPLFADVVALSPIATGRAAELRNAATGARRAVVVAASDELVRAAANADLFCVGVSSGTCSKPRLHRASPGVVYTSLEGLQESLESGADDLITAGLLPASHDA